MPQIIAAIIAIVIVVWVVAVIVWLVQWLIASLVWLFQAILLPAIIFLLPTLVALGILTGLLWGGWVSSKNYFESIWSNVNPMGGLKLVVRRGVIASQSMTLVLACSVFLSVAGFYLYQWTLYGFQYVKGYYDLIVFPAFHIEFPFWS